MSNIMSGINILSTGAYTPLLDITNDDMSKIVETNDEWIKQRVGIAERQRRAYMVYGFHGSKAGC